MSSAVSEQAAQDQRQAWLNQALGQIPRLLSLQDRNPFTPTFGCFHRPYWLEKTTDFPDAMAQIGALCLALVYAHNLPGNQYWRQPKIRDWAIAGLDYWTRIQHADGSFDEFYPYERGWGTPTALTLYTASETYRLLGAELPAPVAERTRLAMRRAAGLVAAGQSEEDNLANHHAMACLALWTASELLEDSGLRVAFERCWQGFLQYQNPREGWSLEYDGADPGYLSGSISLLARLYQRSQQPRFLEVLRPAIEFASHFVYPDGSYSGGIGSRQTTHFYPYGFEALAGEIELAGAVAQQALKGIASGALAPPAAMPDRYLPWRVAEYVQAYLEASPPKIPLPLLPYERPPFRRWFPEACIQAERLPEAYMVANLARGGVVRLFATGEGRLIYADGGLLGRLDHGELVTSQWIDPSYRISVSGPQMSVEGALHRISSTAAFTPLRMALFRGALSVLGRSPKAAHLLKRRIRRRLILGAPPAPVYFRRRICLASDALTILDHVQLRLGVRLAGLQFGDDFAVRYVPQSRYFQLPDLNVYGYRLADSQLNRLHKQGTLTVTRRVEIPSGRVTVSLDGEAAAPLGGEN